MTEQQPNALYDLTLQVGEIIKVEPHPNADKLFIEEVNMGDHTRQIVSGLKEHYEPEELVGKKVVIISNLKSAKLRGVESEGMLLAAENEEKQVGVVEAPHANPGELVHDGTTYTSLVKQATIEDVMKVTFIAEDGKVIVNGKPLQTENELVTVDKGITGKVF